MQINFKQLEIATRDLLNEPSLSSHQRILAMSVRGIAETLATKVVAHPDDVEALRVLANHLCVKLCAKDQARADESLERYRSSLVKLCNWPQAMEFPTAHSSESAHATQN